MKAVIYDWDGVAVDTESLHELKEREFSKRHNYKHTLAVKRAIMGRRDQDVVKFLKEKFRLNQSIKELVDERWAIYDKFFFKKVNLMPGFLDSVKLFKRLGFVLAIATSSKPKYVEYAFKKFKLKKYFNLVVYSDQVVHGKPRPDIFYLAAKKLKLKPSNCIVLEDSINGVVAAKSAGMKCIAVIDTRYSNKKDFVKEADLVITSLLKATSNLIKRL